MNRCYGAMEEHLAETIKLGKAQIMTHVKMAERVQCVCRRYTQFTWLYLYMSLQVSTSQLEAINICLASCSYTHLGHSGR